MDLDNLLTMHQTLWQKAIDERSRATSIALSKNTILPTESKQLAIAAQVAWQIQADTEFAWIEYIESLKAKV